jgi:hypothetical protein
MKPCHSCRADVDEYLLEKQLGPLRDLTADDFNLCADCVTVVPETCVACDGAVYVPRGASVTPDRCPACRFDAIQRTGRDPGWTRDSGSLAP